MLWAQGVSRSPAIGWGLPHPLQGLQRMRISSQGTSFTYGCDAESPWPQENRAVLLSWDKLNRSSYKSRRGSQMRPTGTSLLPLRASCCCGGCQPQGKRALRSDPTPSWCHSVFLCCRCSCIWGGAFRAERSRWWEQKTCFIGVWIAEFTAMEAITQYFVCRVQRQQTSQGLGLFWLGLLVPLTWGSAGETAFMVNVCCWAEDWPLWPLCSEILPIPVLGPQDGQKSRASGHGWLKGVEERDLFVLGMGMFWETCTLEKWVLL